MSELNWYVVHTYSGYENKVKANIEKTIENRKLQDQIFEVRVPLQDVVEMKGTDAGWDRVEKRCTKAGIQKNVPGIRTDQHGDER